jgi:hypothetical protein
MDLQNIIGDIVKLVINKMANFLPASLNEVGVTSSVGYVVFTDGSKYYVKRVIRGKQSILMLM